MAEQTASPMPKRIIYALCACICIGLVILMYRTKILPRQSETSPVRQKEEVSYNGEMKLIPDGDRTIYKPGEDVVIVVYADSKGQPVVGYDVLINVSTQEAELIDVESLKEGFEVSSKAVESGISITGLQDLKTDSAPIFRNEPIARLTFSPQTAGRIDFPIAFKLGETTDSNMVVDIQDILGEVSSTHVYVSDSKAKQMKRRDRIQLDGVELQLDAIIYPEPQCVDCTTTALFRFVAGDVELDEQIEVRLGGLAGTQWSEVTARGYTIAVKEFAPDTLEVIAQPLE